MKLTERKVETLTVEQSRKDRLVFDDDQRGLAVRVDESARAGKPNGRTYLCQYSLHGRKWRLPLGACSALTLANARDAAAAIMGDVARGMNPAAERKKAAAAERAKRVRDRLTLRVFIDDWERLRLAERRESYATETVRALHSAFGDHLDDAAEDLDRAAVVRALDALTRRHKRKDGSGKPKGAPMAGRTAAYGHAMYSWGVKRGVVQSNPFADLPIDKSSTKRERTPDDEEVGEILRAASEAPPPYGLIIHGLIFTGQRRRDVAGMTWGELSADLATWVIPGTRAKNGITHVVPLSEPVRALIRATLPEDEKEALRVMVERRAGNALVFPGAAGVFAGWSKSKIELDKAIIEARAKAAAKAGTTAAPLVPWTVHDLRRVIASGLQRLGVRFEVTESVLAHVSGSRGGVAGIYQRHDWATEKRAALDAWARHVMALVEQRPAAENILVFARA
jgi:integrase